MEAEKITTENSTAQQEYIPLENIASWESKNCYEQLGIAPTATAADIKSAFRKLSVKYHPDKVNDNEELRKNYEEVIKIINNANDKLSDPAARAKYDRETARPTFSQPYSDVGTRYEQSRHGRNQTEEEIFADINEFFKNNFARGMNAQDLEEKLRNMKRGNLYPFEKIARHNKKEILNITDNIAKTLTKKWKESNGIRRHALSHNVELPRKKVFGFPIGEKENKEEVYSKYYADITIQNGLLFAKNAYDDDEKMDVDVTHTYGADPDIDNMVTYYTILDPETGKELCRPFNRIYFSPKETTEGKIELIIGRQPFRAALKEEDMIDPDDKYSYGDENEHMTSTLGYKKDGHVYFFTK